MRANSFDAVEQGRDSQPVKPLYHMMHAHGSCNNALGIRLLQTFKSIRSMRGLEGASSGH